MVINNFMINYTPNDSLNTIIRSYKIIYKIVR